MVKQQQFKIGDVLNFSWDSVYGKVIKLYNYKEYGYSKENKWTHSAIIGDIQGDNVIVYEALNKGFVKNTYSIKQLNNWLKNKYMIVGVPIKPLTNVTKNCEKYIGTPYGWFDIFNIGLYLIFKKFAFTISTGTKQIICSEAVARILYDSSKKQIEFEKEFNKKYDLITPIDLYYSKQIKWK